MAISPELGLAILKGEQIIDKAFRDAVLPGEYDIDALVHIRGKMTVAPDHESKVAARVPWQKVAAVLFSKLNGVTMESVLEEAIKGNGRVEALAEQVEERAKKAIEALVASTKQPVRGAVRVRVEVSEVTR